MTITLLDSNDNPPEFQPNNTYNIRISEGLELGSTVMTFVTLDRDKNQVVSYEMNSDPNNNFDVVGSTGNKFVSSIL